MYFKTDQYIGILRSESHHDLQAILTCYTQSALFCRSWNSIHGLYLLSNLCFCARHAATLTDLVCRSAQPNQCRGSDRPQIEATDKGHYSDALFERMSHPRFADCLHRHISLCDYLTQDNRLSVYPYRRSAIMLDANPPTTDSCWSATNIRSILLISALLYPSFAERLLLA